MDSLTVTYFVAQLAHVPNLHGLIPASREQPPAVGAERHAADQADVAAEGTDQAVLVVAIPDLDSAVLTRRGDPPALAVRAEGHGTDVPGVSAEGLQLLAGLHVPDLDGVPFASRHQAPAVGAERHGQTIAAVLRVEGAAGFLFLLQAGRVPQIHLAVAARRSQVPAVGAARHPHDTSLP